jgi:hypothetical protein
MWSPTNWLCWSSSGLLSPPADAALVLAVPFGPSVLFIVFFESLMVSGATGQAGREVRSRGGSVDCLRNGAGAKTWPDDESAGHGTVANRKVRK